MDHRNSIRAGRHAAAVLVLSLAGVVQAQTNLPAQSAPYSAFEWMQRQASGNTHRIGMEIGGVRAPAERVNLSGWSPAGNYGVNMTATGATIGASLEIPDPNGKFRANYRATITKAAFGEAMGILVRNAANLAGPIGVVAMVADMALQWDREKLRANTGPGAVAQPFQIPDPDGMYITMWAGSNGGREPGPCPTSTVMPGISSTDQKYCGSPHPATGNIEYNGTYYYRVIKCTDTYWPTIRTNDPVPSCAVLSGGSGWKAANWDEARPAYEAMSPLPSDTLQKMVDYAKQQDGKNGIEPFKINVTPSSVSGPATLPPTETKEKTTFTRPGANGQPETVERTTTRTKETGVSYEGDRVKVTPKETTTVTDKITDSTGQVREVTDTTTTETTGDTPTKEQQEQETSDLCKMNPDILACAKPELDTPDDTIPKEDRTITYEPEDLFGTGSCPADLTMSLSTLNGAVAKVWDWEKTCSMALPLRAIVISLATFAAFLIVMPGETRV